MATNFRTLIPMLNLLLLFFFSIPGYSATDTITQGQQIRDWEQLNSANNLFRLQFFGPTTSKLRYLGIFYNIPPPTYEGIYDGDDKAVWVANRNNPIPDASGNLMIDVDGKLKIFYAGNNAVSVFDSLPATGNITATLLNNGNLVLRELETDGSVKQVLWKSFDYPTDTLLPGMKLGINHRTGHIWSLTSWISDELPASGSFTLGLDPNVTNQLNIWWRGNISWTSGPWRNNRFANAGRLSVYDGYNFTYVSNEDEIYFTYSVRYRNGSHPRYTINQDGNLSEEKGARPPFGSCFPAHVADTGCVEQNLPECRRKYYWFFIQRQGIIYGDGFRFDESMKYSLFDCEAFCTNDCSCVAYASISYNKTGCQIWRKGLRFQATTDSLDHAYMFVQDKDNNWLIWLCLGLGIFVILLAISICCIVRRCKRRRKNKKRLGLNLTASSKYSSINNQESDQTMGDGVHLFSYEAIAAATNNFSSMNKLGEGGFGPVYKGKLPDGQQVAIKRLSSSSGQGVVEFKNEILLIAKLQHTNLVRLLGSCIKGDEKILVYEYMPNKSLDFFLFDSSKSGLLNWTDRFKIIEGIAQGLLYLHKYSRLRIIHRDLKASNILLDDNLNPKISDFGMARIFGINQDEANTNRVVGTYGYMAPEYAIKGIVSLKTDVFSYGVLLLEIVSGKKNNSCFNLQHPLNLIGLAWKLWKEDRGLELMDPTLGDSYPQKEAMRCIQVGLLCVQDQADDRPSMSDVVSMLTNETKEVRAPKQPAFFIETDKLEAAAVERFESSSTNEITISVMEPR